MTFLTLSLSHHESPHRKDLLCMTLGSPIAPATDDRLLISLYALVVASVVVLRQAIRARAVVKPKPRCPARTKPATQSYRRHEMPRLIRTTNFVGYIFGVSPSRSAALGQERPRKLIRRRGGGLVSSTSTESLLVIWLMYLGTVGRLLLFHPLGPWLPEVRVPRKRELSGTLFPACQGSFVQVLKLDR